jgi:predicted permease
VVFANLIAARGPDSPGESRVASWLAGVASIVFLVACANVAGLLLARNEQRSRETEVRLALGAGRVRIGAEVLFETLALAALGGALAILFARWGGVLIRTSLLPDVYFPASTLTPRLGLFTVATTVLAAILAGVTPALRSAEPRSRNSRLQSGSVSTGTAVRRVLTVVQAGLAVVLLVGAGLFVRSLDRVRSLDLGLDVDRLAMAQVTLRDPDMARTDQIALFEELSRRLIELPSVESAASTSSGLTSSMAVETRIRGLDSLPRMPGGGPYVYVVPPEYFATGGLEIIEGRSFTTADVPGTDRVAVLSETMARTLWPAGAALGQCILRRARGQDECIEVVGVAQDAARNGYFDAPFMAYYLPLVQNPAPPRGIYIRAAGTADGVIREAAALLRSTPAVRFATVTTLRGMLDPQARTWSLGATMFSAFGLLALLVAVVGLYSLLAFEVAQRTREIGIRTALGAQKARVLRDVVSQGAFLGAVGVALGLVVAYIGAPYIQDLLFEVSPRDMGVFGGVAAVLLAVSAAASLVPGLRATRVDPVTALRAE